MIDVGALGIGQHETWLELMALAEHHPLHWTLIGAQMVVLHAAAAGRLPPRSSEDADVLVNVRLMHDGTRALSQTLVDRGYVFDAPNLIAVGHRFRRGSVVFDVLGPDGMRDDTELTTVPPARTVGVPGGTQALRRTRVVEVRSGAETGHVPRPDLLGAILIKARAIEVDDQPDNQRQGSDVSVVAGRGSACVARGHGAQRARLVAQTSRAGKPERGCVQGTRKARDGRLPGLSHPVAGTAQLTTPYAQAAFPATAISPSVGYVPCLSRTRVVIFGPMIACRNTEVAHASTPF